MSASDPLSLAALLTPETCIAAPHAATIRGLVHQLLGLPRRAGAVLNEQQLVEDFSELGLFERREEFPRGGRPYEELESGRACGVTLVDDWQVLYGESETLEEPIVCFARFPEGTSVGAATQMKGANFILLLLTPPGARRRALQLITRLVRLKRRWDDGGGRALFEAQSEEELCAVFLQAEQQLMGPPQ